MKRLLGTILFCLFVGLPASTHAQIIAYKAAALSGSWYAPSLDFYARSDDYLLDFTGSVLGEVQLEFEILGVATLRTAVGHWQQRRSADVGLEDPENARRHTATLRIVPVTASLIYAPGVDGGPRPILGVGITQNLIQRSFQRARLNGTTEPETFAGNGRDFTYHGLAGILFPLAGPLWAGLESRYVWGTFQEEQDPTQSVSLDGMQVGLSLRYHIR